MLNTTLLTQLRQKNPLVHNITNIVVANYVANGLLAIGASPIMSNAIEEMDELAAICSSVAINIGTLTTEQIKAMLTSGKAANKNNTPILLDPVGVGATNFRRKAVNQLLKEIKFTAIRGNAGEMATLAEIDWQAKGVDAGSGTSDISTIAKTVANTYKTIAIVSSAVDVVSDGTKVVEIENGTPLFQKITGSGCLHGAVCTAFIALAPDDLLSACVSACVTYAIAGELAAKENISSGTFTTALIDALANVQETDIQRKQNIRVLA